MDASLKTRTITAICGIPALVLILLAPVPVVTAAVLIASMIGLYEYFKATELLKHPNLCIIGAVGAVIVVLCSGLSASVSLFLLFLYIIVLLSGMIFNKSEADLVHVAMILFGLIYIPYFMSNIILVRTLENGKVFIWLIFLGAFLSDTFAYFTGSAVGRHKLCPTISPHKTVEGAIGGIIGCGITFVVFGIIMNIFLEGTSFNLWLMFPLGALTSVVSQIGDLTASSIKRQYNIKDFGRILPGHGGILDRIDSILTVAPFLYIVLSNINIMI
ncbi:MAG: phosphatidate cytidylyltransferase [Monoglobaceae bacterium]